MPIIPQTAPIDPIQARINQIMQLNMNLLTSNKNGLLEIFHLVYFTNQIAVGLHPVVSLITDTQAVFDHFGTDAVKLFIAADLVTKLIQVVDPTFIAPVPPFNYVINPDGTVTVSAKI